MLRCVYINIERNIGKISKHFTKGTPFQRYVRLVKPHLDYGDIIYDKYGDIIYDL